MFCRKCGTQLSDQAVFCHNCGAKVERSTPQPSARQAEPPVQIRQAQPALATAPIPAPAAAPSQPLTGTYTIRYIASLLTFYLKGEITTDPRSVRFRTPNTIFGLIPLGAKNDMVPINQVSTASTNLKVKTLSLIVGLLAAIGGIAAMRSSAAAGLILLIIGAAILLDAIEVNLVLTMTSGVVKAIDFFIFDKAKADEISQHINSMIYNRLDNTDLSYYHQRIR